MSRLLRSSIVVLLTSTALPLCHLNAEPIDFDTEIVPILSKAGCNAASCHGASTGQGGFRLSLFGGDPDLDYRTIVYELSGRRINPKDPAESLLITKPTEQLEHGGGQVLEFDTPAVQTLVEWVSAGSQRLRLRDVERIEVAPTEFSAIGLPATFRLKVEAIFSDGTRRDVSQTAIHTSQNEDAVSVTTDGRATVKGPGRHNLIVRYAGHVTSIPITTPIGKNPIEIPHHARSNWIDDEINQTLKALHLDPAATTDDASFLRRVKLDLTGRLPSQKALDELPWKDSAVSRARMIDSLLSSSEFTEYWTYLLAQQLRLRKPGKDLKSLERFHAWLKERVADDTGWDEVARELIMAEGTSDQHGPATVHRFFATAREQAEYVSEVLLGVRLRCANCHNHPLDRWTQDDYHGLAAIFAGYERGPNVRFSGRGSVIHPRNGLPARPRIPGDSFVTNATDGRQPLADWMIARDNPYFARAMVGRVWQSLMGQALVSPVDDLRATNPASHPVLFDRLADYFVEHDYRLRPLIRLICNSAAYQRRSSHTESSSAKERYYAHATKKLLSAAVLADAIGDVTGVKSNYAEFQRAIHLVDRSSDSRQLQILGQCVPGEPCESTGATVGIATHLHLMNGKLLNEKLSDPSSLLQRLLRENTETRDIVHAFFEIALSRKPTNKESEEWIKQIESGEEVSSRVGRLEDFVWALLNCDEFRRNH